MVELKTSTKLEESTRTRVTLKEPEVESDDALIENSSDQEENNSDNSDNSEVDDKICDNDVQINSNAGWADVMQKILKTKKPKRKKTIVLSKAKRLCDIKVKEETDEISFEIDRIKKEVKIEETKESVKREKHIPERKLKKEKSLGIRIKPSIVDRERERILQKIATKGVVQLFNAVRQQQADIHKKLSEAGPLERKREQVLKSIDKNAFLDILMGGSKSISIDNEVKSEKEIEQVNNKNKDDKTWNVLRDDFVMGAKLKDWDKKDVEEDSSAPEDMDSDD